MHLITPFLTLLPLLTLISAQAAAGGGAPVVLPTVATQDSTVRVVNSLFTVNGVTSATQIIFTQTFATAALGSWDLGPTPKVGTIGLGSIQGKVGEVKTSGKEKRWLEGAVPTGWGW